MKTRFRLIPGYIGYWVTETGEVWSNRYWRGHGKSFRRLSQDTDADGYYRVRLCGTRRRAIPIHKLVAVCFLPSWPGPGYEIRHLDGDKRNNHAENLAWGTRRDNALDRKRHGLAQVGSRNANAKLNEMAVSKIRNEYDPAVGAAPLAEKYGVSKTTVRHVVYGDGWKHVGGVRP